MPPIFRVRNLLVQVIHLRCTETESGGCDDSDGGCDPDDDSNGCDGDSGECDIDDSGVDCGTDDSNGCDNGGDSTCPNGGDSNGCTTGGDSTCPNAGDSNGCTTGDNSTCPAGTDSKGCTTGEDSQCPLASGECPVFAGSCRQGSDCTDIWSLCTLHCPDPTLNCDLYPSKVCLQLEQTNCAPVISCRNYTVICGLVYSPAPLPKMPLALCFQSNEPRANPNSLADLDVLRRQLAYALKLVTRRERALARALTPRTEAGVAAAEAHLTRALAELKRIKEYVQARAAKKKAGKRAARAEKKPARARKQRKK